MPMLVKYPAGPAACETAPVGNCGVSPGIMRVRDQRPRSEAPVQKRLPDIRRDEAAAAAAKQQEKASTAA